jgi:hypothetical protein
VWRWTRLRSHSRWWRRRGCRARRRCGRGWRRSRGLRCGSRRRRTLRRRLLLGARGAFFLGLRHDERCGLRERSEGRELRRRQGGRGEQQDAKVCHDVLGPRNRSGSNGLHWHASWSIERLIIRPDCGGLQMVGWFLFHWRNGLHASLFIARSGGAFMWSSDRWRDWECGGRSGRVSVTHPASCPATPAVVVVDRVHGVVVAPPGEDYPEDSPAAARLVVLVSPAVSPAVRSASRLLKF